MTISAILNEIPDFLLACPMLVVLMAFYGIFPDMSILLLPLYLALMALLTIGVGFWLAALNAIYRDIPQFLGLALTAMMYATPIAWPLSQVPVRYRIVFALNPMAIVAEGFRGCLLRATFLSLEMHLVAGVVALFLFWSGLRIYAKFERKLPDLV